MIMKWRWRILVMLLLRRISGDKSLAQVVAKLVTLVEIGTALTEPETEL
jgi:hypothetical protein